MRDEGDGEGPPLSRGLHTHAIPAKFDIDSRAPAPPIVHDSEIPLIRHQKAAVSSASAVVLLRVLSAEKYICVVVDVAVLITN